jgi:hypothetical protein
MRGTHVWCTVAAAVALLDTAGNAGQSRPVPQVRDPIGIAWLIFVDDLHIDFRNTGYLRKLLTSIASDLIRDRDVFAVRSSGPSSLSIDLAADKSLFETAIPRTSGSGLKLADIQKASVIGSGEVEYRVKVAVGAASEMIESVATRNRRRALLYMSNGYTTDVSAQLSALTGAARRSNLTIFAMNPRGLPGSPFADERSPATQNSLRALVEPTRGFALLDQEDFADGMARIRRAMLAAKR